MMFIKITFFFLYLQIFQPMRWLRICAYIGAVFTSLFYLAMTVVLFISSTPRPGETWFSHLAHQNHLTSDTAAPQAVGDPAVPQVAGDIGITQAVVGLAIDIYILVLPIIAVSRLQMPTRRRIGVMLIFLTGLLFVRFRHLSKIDPTKRSAGLVYLHCSAYTTERFSFILTM